MASLPPPSPFPPPPPPAQKKSRAGLIGAAVAVALVGGGVGAFVASRGGGDDTAVATTTTAAAATTTVAETLVITTPETSVPDTTLPDTTVPSGPTPGEGEVVVTDDTGVFSVIAPDTFEVDTAPLDLDGGSVASVTAAGNLDLYGNGYDETGYTVMALPADIAADSDAAIALLNDQLTADCGSSTQNVDLETAIGPARHLVGQACGANGATAVVLAIDETNTGLVFLVVAQGPAGESEVTTLAQAVLESIYIN